MDRRIDALGNGCFTVDLYKSLVLELGLSSVWKKLISILKSEGIENFNKNYINFYDIGKLYEVGLATINKYTKKELGKFYTPKDVSSVMADLLIEKETLTNICDVGCGCGNLVIEVLKKIKDRSEEEFNTVSKNIYLFDLDKIALNICKARISILFDIDENKIHSLSGDFLKRNEFIKNAFVISNPPYSKIKEINKTYEFMECISQSKDLYVGFIEKIISYSKKAVIVSPQSYIVGKNFSKTREKLFQLGNGEIYSFDNVPGALFNGRKEGIFNTNTANGVRASILVFNKSDIKGYRLTHLIRFKNEQRNKIITLNFLKSKLGNKLQDLIKPLKCFKELEDFVYSVKSDIKINDLIENEITKQNDIYKIHINTSARYFILGYVSNLKRSGYFNVYAKDQKSFYLLYALLNSSYIYLWWRMLDGGILFPKNLFLEIPVPNNILVNDLLIDFCKELIKQEKHFLSYKKNAGEVQESIKFPTEYRNKLNSILFQDINFEVIHSNKELIRNE